MEITDFLCSETLDKFNEAFLKFRKLNLHFKRDSENPHFRSSYTSLAEALETTTKPLYECGFFLLQLPLGGIETSRLLNRLTHQPSGQFIQWVNVVPLPKKDPQGSASANTYQKRINLTSSMGLPESDDDGNTASKAPPTKQQQIEDAEARQKPMSNLAGAGKDYKITPKQQGLVFAVSKTKGWSINEVAEYCSLRHGINDWRTISKSMLDDLLKVMDKQDPLSAIDGLVNKDAPPLTDADVPFGS